MDVLYTNWVDLETEEKSCSFLLVEKTDTCRQPGAFHSRELCLSDEKEPVSLVWSCVSSRLDFYGEAEAGMRTGCLYRRVHLLIHWSTPGPGVIRTRGGCCWLSWKQARILSRHRALQAETDTVVSNSCHVKSCTFLHSR